MAAAPLVVPAGGELMVEVSFEPPSAGLITLQQVRVLVLGVGGSCWVFV